MKRGQILRKITNPLNQSATKTALSFFPSSVVSTGMTQSSRESLIDLLFLSLYLDDRLSLAEDDVLTTALDALGWDAIEPREKHIWRAFSKARDVASCANKTSECLAQHAAVIKQDGEQAAAITWLSRVLGSDGLSYTEQHFLKQLEAHLYPNG